MIKEIIKHKYNIMYAVIAIAICFFIPSALNILITNLQTFSDVLQNGIDEGMSTEFQLIFTLASFWIIMKLFGLIAHWLHTCIEEIRTKDKQK